MFIDAHFVPDAVCAVTERRAEASTFLLYLALVIRLGASPVLDRVVANPSVAGVGKVFCLQHRSFKVYKL